MMKRMVMTRRTTKTGRDKMMTGRRVKKMKMKMKKQMKKMKMTDGYL